MHGCVICLSNNSLYNLQTTLRENSNHLLTKYAKDAENVLQQLDDACYHTF